MTDSIKSKPKEKKWNGLIIVIHKVMRLRLFFLHLNYKIYFKRCIFSVHVWVTVMLNTYPSTGTGSGSSVVTVGVMRESSSRVSSSWSYYNTKEHKVRDRSNNGISVKSLIKCFEANWADMTSVISKGCCTSCGVMLHCHCLRENAALFISLT